MPRPISEDEVGAIRDGVGGRLYVYGTTTYDDAFGHHHWVHFCFSFWGAGPKLTSWEYCNQWQETDDDP